MANPAPNPDLLYAQPSLTFHIFNVYWVTWGPCYNACSNSVGLFTFMHWRRKWQPTPVFLPGASQGQGAWWAAIYGVTQSWTWLKRLSSSRKGLRLPWGLSSEESAWNAGDPGSIPGLGRSPGGGYSHPLYYSCLEKFHGQRIRAGYSPQGCKELDKTKATERAHTGRASGSTFLLTT